MRKRRIFEVVRLSMLIFGIGFSVFSLLTTFMDIPPVIKDWRIGLTIGFLFFVISVLWYLIELQGKYLWVEPKIKFSTEIEQHSYDIQTTKRLAYLSINNEEEIEITDCYVTLEHAINLYGKEMNQIEVVRDEILQWEKREHITDNCRTQIPPDDARRVLIAESQGGHPYFSSCAGQWKEGLMGLHLIKVRMDGKFGGRDMKPMFFDGYLYVINMLETDGPFS